MPYINRLRLVNVQYNGGRQMYEDFMLTMLGKSVVYDMENGGGKSVLMNMLIQSVLPKTDLSDLEENKYESLFKGAANDKPHHSLIEWELDEGSDYRYMVTGFCARKAKSSINGKDNEEDLHKSSVEYFTYVIYYTSACKYDIASLNLCTKEENKNHYIDYDELRELLFRLKGEKQPVYIFDSRINYWRHLRSRNILDLEWNLIRKVNPKENYITTYFTEHKTSRRLIENYLLELIEEISNLEQDGAGKKISTEAHLANTLLDIKEQLKKLLKEKESYQQYETVISFYKSLEVIEQKLHEGFTTLECLNKQFVGVYNKLKQVLQELNARIAALNSSRDSVHEQIAGLEFANKCLNIQREEIKMKAARIEAEMAKEALDHSEKLLVEHEAEINEAKARNKFIRYKTDKLALETVERQIEQSEKEQGPLKLERDRYGYNLKTELEKEVQELGSRNDKCDSLFREAKEKENQLDNEAKNLIKVQGEKKGRLQIKQEINNTAQQKANQFSEKLHRAGCAKWLFQPETALAELKEEIGLLNSDLLSSEENIKELESANKQKEIEKVALAGELKTCRKELDQNEQLLADYAQKKRAADKLVEKYFKNGSFGQTKEKINEEIKHDHRRIAQCEIRQKIVNQKMQLLQDKGYYLPNEDIQAFAEHLTKKGFETVFFGADYLINDVSDDERKELLLNNPLLPYSLMLNGDAFKKLQENDQVLNMKVSDHPVPVFNYEKVRAKELGGYPDVVFSCGDKRVFYENADLTEFKRSLSAEQEGLSKSKRDLEIQLDNKINDQKNLGDFLVLQEFVEDWKAQREYLFGRKEELERAMAACEKEIKSNTQKISELLGRFGQIKERLAWSEEQKANLEGLIGVGKELAELSQEMAGLKKDIEEYETLYTIAEENLKRQKELIAKCEGELRRIGAELSNLNQELSEVANCPENEFLNLGLDEARKEYQASCNALNMAAGGLKPLREKKDWLQKSVDRLQKEISAEHNLTLEYFFTRDNQQRLLPVSDEEIAGLNQKRNELRNDHSKKQQIYNDLNKKYQQLTGEIKGLKSTLGADYIIHPGLASVEQVDEEIGQNKANIGVLSEKLNSLRQETADLEQRQNDYTDEFKSYQHFITDKNIDVNDVLVSSEILAYDILQKKYAEGARYIDNQKEKLRREIKRIEEEAKKLTLNYDYVSEINNWVQPESLHDAEQHLQAITLIIQLIEEKLAELEEEIRSLEKYQDAFVDQCLQIAETVLTKLKKLDSLPKIDVYGVKVRMVELRYLNEYTPELKKESIQSYVYELVGKIDAEEYEIGKLNQALATKVLLSKIIDLNRTRVMVYKVENIPENCRYIAWDNLEGSQGQANMMALIFMASMLAFIRSLRLGENSIKSKKVMVVDNPFASTKTYHLWEPIFEILKKNNFQLIAASHDIPETLVSKFDIFYGLDRVEYSNHKQSVVVKRIRTQLDLSKVHYHEIKQASLF